MKIIYKRTIRSYLQPYSATVTSVGIASNFFVSIEQYRFAIS